MRHKLLRCRPEQRDVLKGKIEAQEHFQSLIDAFPPEERIEKITVYLRQEETFKKLTDVLLKETNERVENQVIARIKEWERIKKKYLKDPITFLKIWTSTRK